MRGAAVIVGGAPRSAFCEQRTARARARAQRSAARAGLRPRVLRVARPRQTRACRLRPVCAQRFVA
eukprot:11207391-Lingulodinium_polyedra.AAC.1